MEAHTAVVGADAFITCSCGLRVGSPYFHALHVEEQLDLAPTHRSGWPAAHYETVPGARLPQDGVIARNTPDLPATEYTTARLGPSRDATALAALRAGLALVPSLGGADDAAADVGCAMVALGPQALAALSAPGPDALTPFAPKLAGDDGRVIFPEGSNDVLLFVKSPTAAAAAAATAAFLAAAAPALEPGSIATTVGLLNEGRDLSGAIDGTKNPDATMRTVVKQASVPRGDFQGGSYVFCSRFRHRLEAFHALGTEEQNGVRDLPPPAYPSTSSTRPLSCAHLRSRQHALRSQSCSA